MERSQIGEIEVNNDRFKEEPDYIYKSVHRDVSQILKRKVELHRQRNKAPIELDF